MPYRRPSSPERPNPSWLAHVFAPFLGSLVLVAVVGSFDLFGLDAKTRKLSQTILLQVLSPFYPDPRPGERVKPGPGSRVPPSHPVTVVTLDRDLLQRIDATWPLSFRQYAYVTRRILEHEPRVLFLDLFFTEDRGDFAVFAGQLRQMQGRVFVAAPNPCLIETPGPGRLQDWQAGRGLLAGVVSEARPIVADWAGYGDAYPLLVRADAHGDAAGANADSPCGKPGRRWGSPATALFRSYCQESASEDSEDSRPIFGCQEVERSPVAAAFEEPMLVRWSAEVPEESGRLASTQHCHLVEPSWYERVGFALNVMWHQSLAGITGSGSISFQACPSVATVHGNALLPTDEDGVRVWDEEHEELLDGLIRDRVVLVGTDLLGTGDEVVSPVHGKLPGVYLHAMALDNLMSFGSEYLHTPKGNALLELALLAIPLYLVSAVRPYQRDLRLGGLPSRLLLTLAFLLLLALVMAIAYALSLAVAVTLAVARHEEPVNWLGIATAAPLPLVPGLRAIWKGFIQERSTDAPPQFSPLDYLDYSTLPRSAPESSGPPAPGGAGALHVVARDGGGRR